MLRRLIPHPAESAFLVLFWLILANRWTFGSLVLAVFLAVVIPLLTSAWWPERPRLKRPLGLIAYLGIVIWDVIVSSFQVARIILFMPRDQIRSAFVTVPVDLKSPEAISMLAGTITMTPGTLTADFSADGRSLLIHSLHAPDPDEVRDGIKSRYEARLMRIFE
jgi:multicomponent K+:H+ antiporter subunit E